MEVTESQFDLDDFHGEDESPPPPPPPPPPVFSTQIYVNTVTIPEHSSFWRHDIINLYEDQLVLQQKTGIYDTSTDAELCTDVDIIRVNLLDPEDESQKQFLTPCRIYVGGIPFSEIWKDLNATFERAETEPYMFNFTQDPTHEDYDRIFKKFGGQKKKKKKNEKETKEKKLIKIDLREGNAKFYLNASDQRRSACTVDIRIIPFKQECIIKTKNEGWIYGEFFSHLPLVGKPYEVAQLDSFYEQSHTKHTHLACIKVGYKDDDEKTRTIRCTFFMENPGVSVFLVRYPNKDSIVYMVKMIVQVQVGGFNFSEEVFHDGVIVPPEPNERPLTPLPIGVIHFTIGNSVTLSKFVTTNAKLRTCEEMGYDTNRMHYGAYLDYKCGIITVCKHGVNMYAMSQFRLKPEAILSDQHPDRIGYLVSAARKMNKLKNGKYPRTVSMPVIDIASICEKEEIHEQKMEKINNAKLEIEYIAKSKIRRDQKEAAERQRDIEDQAEKEKKKIDIQEKEKADEDTEEEFKKPKPKPNGKLKKTVYGRDKLKVMLKPKEPPMKETKKKRKKTPEPAEEKEKKQKKKKETKKKNPPVEDMTKEKKKKRKAPAKSKAKKKKKKAPVESKQKKNPPRESKEEKLMNPDEQFELDMQHAKREVESICGGMWHSQQQVVDKIRKLEFTKVDSMEEPCDRAGCTKKTPCITVGNCLTCGVMVPPVHCHDVQLASVYALPYNSNQDMKNEWFETTCGTELEDVLAKYLKRMGVPPKDTILETKSLTRLLDGGCFGFVEHFVQEEGQGFVHMNVVILPEDFSVCRVNVASRQGQEINHEEKVSCGILKCRECQSYHDVSDHEGEQGLPEEPFRTPEETDLDLGQLRVQLDLWKKAKMKNNLERLELESIDNQLKYSGDDEEG